MSQIGIFPIDREYQVKSRESGEIFQWWNSVYNPLDDNRAAAPPSFWPAIISLGSFPCPPVK